MLQHFAVTFSAIFLAELPDKTMFATLLLSTKFRRRFPVWCGVSLGYATHMILAVVFGSALSHLPKTPIHIIAGVMFFFGGVMTWRAIGDNEESESKSWSVAKSNMAVMWTAFSVILVAEFGDLTQLATAGFAARFNDPIAVGLGSIMALSSISGLAVLAGARIHKHLPLHTIQRVAAILFIAIGTVTVVSALI